MKLSNLSDCDVIILDDYTKFVKEKCKASSFSYILPDFYLTRREYIKALFLSIINKCIYYKVKLDDIGGKLGEWVVYVLENILNIRDFTDSRNVEYLFDGLPYEIPDYQYIDDDGNLVFYVDYIKSKEFNFDLKKGMEDFAIKEKQSIKGNKKLYDVYGIDPEDFESIYYPFLREVFKSFPKKRKQGIVVRPSKYLVFYLIFLYGTKTSMDLLLRALREMNIPVSRYTYQEYKRAYIFIVRLLKAKGVIDKDFDHREGYFNYKNRRK